ncbi:glycosyltransferase family 2 protein [Candidatus Enterococcus ferrettii]|uniref:Glycosyltransferase 2-like domain-containing protein n=1 Tax=Candidatus Enterococcus ferrettii TaxID=2815324 RepID=A0ABV0EWJ0_9ENTE|nr:glycosyltransferase family 2 protein [Enterococcus sp. 665A]MBO1342758.1 glycosyltransferase family 2 protein [Enterococcus sp. 665A]
MHEKHGLSVSVCMATYNGRAFIEAQLDSILPQLSKYDELVVSDNSSTDGTWELLQAYQKKDQRIQLFKNEQPGVIGNFEKAIRLGQKELIFLCDQDDLWQTNKIEVMRAYFQEHPEVTVVISDLIIVDNDFQILVPSYQAMRHTKPGFWHNLLRSSYIGAGMAFRKELKDLILPIPKEVPMHDMWIGLLADHTKGVAFIPNKLVYYRRHGLNTTEIKTTASKVQQFSWRWKAWQLVRKRLRENKKKA